MGSAPGGMQGYGWMMAAGAMFDAWGSIESGRFARVKAEQQRVAMQFEAEEAEKQAGQVLAISQQQAREEQRQGRYVASRALAVAAASGGGVSDPTIVNLIAKGKGEATYRANVALYQGEAKARQLRLQALGGNLSGDWAIANGLRTEEQYDYAAVGSALKGGASLYARYGMNGPGRGDSATINQNPSNAG